MSETVFSRIIRREIPADIVYETETILAFRDITPKAPVHVLVIPKKPISTLNAAVAEDVVVLGEMMLATAVVAKQLGIDESGYRVVLNCNADAGQTVFHVHAHVLGGRELAWPPG
ncbi:MAG: histidine triad nucleotide-binding protein [Candidatus Kapaibacterium sp.]